MTEQAMRIVNALFDWKDGRFIDCIAYYLNIPEASIRRSIQELRREGYPITLKDGVVSLYPRG